MLLLQRRQFSASDVVDIFYNIPIQPNVRYIGPVIPALGLGPGEQIATVQRADYLLL